MRTIFSDADQGFNDAEWFHKELKCSSMATIHDGSPYTSQLAKVAAKHFKELGGEIVAEEAVAPTDVDMRPVLTRVAVKKPCVLYFPVFIAAAAQIARQSQEIGDLKNTQLIAGSVVMAPRISGGCRGRREGDAIDSNRYLTRGDGQGLPGIFGKV